mmetsp:Transcript_82454/g.148809  ORF Transcript_82454/g.148809 Transcript_82454/m.148809 type:complete len:467 (+) Transcript_82454:1280-2680(+)
MHLVGPVQDLVHDFLAAGPWVGGAQHVTANVAAGRDGVHASLVDGAHAALDVPLHNAVELPGLTSGDLQRAVGELAADVVHGQPLLSCAVAARQADSDHEAEGVLHAQLLSLLAHVTVILLVAAVELDHLGVLERHLAGGDVVEAGFQAPPELVRLRLDDFIVLHWAVVIATTANSLVDTELRVEHVLPLAKPSAVLVDVLVIAEAGSHQARRPDLLQNLVQVLGRLREVDLRILCALAPVVGVSQAKNAVFHAAQLAVQFFGFLGDLRPKPAPVAGELALTSCGDAENDQGLRGQGVHVEGIHGDAAHRAAGKATISALARDSLGALLRMAGVRRVEDGHRLRSVSQALGESAGIVFLHGTGCGKRLLGDQSQQVLPGQEALDLCAHLGALGREGGATGGLAARVVPEGRPVLVALHRRGLGQEHQGRPVGKGRCLREGRAAGSPELGGGDEDSAVLHGPQDLEL